jgi:superfamily II DNA or RNA helicase
MIQLRTWQTDAITEVKEILENGGDRATIASAPASGKTIFACQLVKDLMSIYGFDQIVIVSPTENVRDKWQEDLSRFGFQLKTKGLRTRSDRDYEDFHGMTFTYSYAANMCDLLSAMCLDSTVVVFDEAHHMGDSNNSTWGAKCRHAFDSCGFKLLLTGTPWRTSGEPIPFANYNEDGFCKPSYSYTIGNAVADKVCQRPEIILRDSSAEFVKSGDKFHFKSLKDSKKESREDLHYSALIEDGDTFIGLFKEADKKLSELRENKHPDAGGIIIAKTKTMAHMYADIMKATFGQSAELVHSEMNNAKEKIRRFKKGTDKWIISVDMIGEGTDIPRLEVEIYLGAKKATICLHQYWMRPARIRSRESKETEHCYIYCLNHSKLNRVAKEIEKDIEVKIKEKEEINVIDKTEDEGGTKPPPPPPPPGSEIVMIDSELGEKTIACASEYYSSDEVTAAEKYLENMKHKVPTSAVCELLRHIKKGEVIERQEEIDSTPLEVKKEEIRKRLSSAINNMAHSLAKEEGRQKADREHFKRVRRVVNRKFNLSSVDHATYDELKSMLEYVASIYTEVA